MATFRQQYKLSKQIKDGAVVVTAKAILDFYRQQLSFVAQPRLARSFHSSSYVECGFKNSQPLLGKQPTNTFFEADWTFSAALGNAIHDKLQSELTASGVLVSEGVLAPGNEVALSEKTLTQENYKQLQLAKIGGRVDAILKRPGTGEMVVLEIKTVQSKYLQETGKWPDWYTDKLLHFETQVQLYMHLLDITDGIVLVISQNDVTLDLLGIITTQNDKGEYVASADWEGNAEAENSEYRFEVADEYAVQYDPNFIYPELARLENQAALVALGKSPAPEPHRGGCHIGKHKCQYWDLCPLPENRRTDKLIDIEKADKHSKGAIVPKKAFGAVRAS